MKDIGEVSWGSELKKNHYELLEDICRLPSTVTIVIPNDGAKHRMTVKRNDRREAANDSISADQQTAVDR